MSISADTRNIGEISADISDISITGSWWSVHTAELGLSKNLVGKSYRWKVVLMVVVAPERLCDYCNATGVRHGRWMDRQNLPHGKTLTLIFPNSSMALIPC